MTITKLLMTIKNTLLGRDVLVLIMFFQSITNAPYRSYAEIGVLKLATNSLNPSVNGPLIAIVIITPDMINNLLS